MTKKILDVVVVGELNIDLVFVDVPFPEYEKEHLARDMRFTMGSSSAITAHNLSALGTRVGFIGKIGSDNFGEFMVRQLESGGVDCSGIINEPGLKTGATIVLANSGHKALLTYLGAMANLTIDNIDWDFIKRARHLHLGCYYLQTGIKSHVPALFEKAKSFGLTTSLDTNWDPDEKWGKDLDSVLEHTDIFLPNDAEAIQIANTENINDAIETLRKKVRVLAVKCGQNGGVVSVGEEQYRAPGYPVTVIETTGAGDSFNAGFIHKFMKQENWLSCLRFGNACGAIAVTEIGGTGAFINGASLSAKLKNIYNSDHISYSDTH
jgi:sugar/nucleoside kinase (ribokinase family)